MCTRPEHADYIEKVFPVRRRPLSNAALETLSIIAYKQPVTRLQIEAIRGVKVEGVLQTLWTGVDSRTGTEKCSRETGSLHNHQ